MGETIPHRYNEIKKGRSKENRLEVYCLLQSAKDHHNESARLFPMIYRELFEASLLKLAA